MGKRRRILLAVLLVLVVVGLAWALTPSGPPEPVYEGKPVSYWLKHHKVVTGVMTIGSASTVSTLFGGADVQMDSNAVPFLAKLLETREGPMMRAYAAVRSKLPPSLQDHLPIAIPATTMRMFAAIELGRLRNDAKQAIPALIRAMRADEDSYVRISATLALGEIGWNDSVVKEALLQTMKDNNADVSTAASQALGSLDPEAAAKAGVK